MLDCRRGHWPHFQKQLRRHKRTCQLALASTAQDLANHVLGFGKSKVVQMVRTVVTATHAQRARSDADGKQTTRRGAGASRANLQQAWIRRESTSKDPSVILLCPSERYVAAKQYLSKRVCSYVCTFRLYNSIVNCSFAFLTSIISQPSSHH